MKLVLFVTALALAAPAVAKQKRVDYAAYAGAPVGAIQFSHLYNWERTRGNTMAVWTKPSTAYVLTFAHKCDAPGGRYTVKVGGVDGTRSVLAAGMGDVTLGQLRCRIVRIQPLDLAAMKLARL